MPSGCFHLISQEALPEASQLLSPHVSLAASPHITQKSSSDRGTVLTKSMVVQRMSITPFGRGAVKLDGHTHRQCLSLVACIL